MEKKNGNQTTNQPIFSHKNPTFSRVNRAQRSPALSGARIVRAHLHGELRRGAAHEARRHVRGGALALEGWKGMD